MANGCLLHNPRCFGHKCLCGVERSQSIMGEREEYEKEALSRAAGKSSGVPSDGATTTRASYTSLCSDSEETTTAFVQRARALHWSTPKKKTVSGLSTGKGHQNWQAVHKLQKSHLCCSHGVPVPDVRGLIIVLQFVLHIFCSLLLLLCSVFRMLLKKMLLLLDVHSYCFCLHIIYFISFAF